MIIMSQSHDEDDNDSNDVDDDNEYDNEYDNDENELVHDLDGNDGKDDDRCLFTTV